MNNSTRSWFYSCTSSNQFFSRQCLKGTAPNIFHDHLCVSTEKNHTQIETWDKPTELCHHMFTFLELLDLLSNIPHPALRPGERLLGTTLVNCLALWLSFGCSQWKESTRDQQGGVWHDGIYFSGSFLVGQNWQNSFLEGYPLLCASNHSLSLHL